MDKSFIDLFEEQVLKTPGNIAVVFEGEQSTYTDLNERSNKLAWYLQSKGVTDETLVPLYIERGINMMVGILGIMKAGGAYVPIDRDFPLDRISYMLKDTGASLLVSSKQSAFQLPGSGGIEIIEIESVPGEQKNNLSTKVAAAQLAYVIYTSGSTGMPKGVMVEHRNLVDYVNGLADKTRINECGSFALVSTIATDLGNTVIYASLVSGGALHIFSTESVSNIELLHHYFKVNNIECLKIVPSHWKALNMDGRLLLPAKLLIFGGEALPEKIVEDIRLTGVSCIVVNHYGPTETTIGKLLHIVEAGSKYEYTVPIGKPFSNTKVLVLTKNLKLCPIGIPGQLYIAGDGVARGYLNNPELTKEKFIPNPFSKENFQVMYNTGDLVKYLPDGNILFIGRADNQVKIRGYRVELGEIEGIFQSCQLVSQAVVLARDDKQGNKRLVGYIVPEGYYDRESILSFVKDKLPDYMVPAILMEMQTLPLTANGKVDRNALPDPDASELLSKQYVAPTNEVESKLATIWENVLEVDQVGIQDDFFQLGGHSLLAVRLVSSIRKAFLVEMPIGYIFDFPTVQLLAEQVKNLSQTGVMSSIKVETRPEKIPLSYSQERLWFIDRLGGSIQYHRPAVIRLKGKLNYNALNDALKKVVSRHEVLRTVIQEQDGMAFQVVKETDLFNLTIIEGSDFDNEPKAIQKKIELSVKAPFDLSKDDMMRAALIKLPEDEHILVITVHHIASDGWSVSVFVKEMVELYSAFTEGRAANLTTLTLQYADFSIWQRNHLQSDGIAKKMDYWKNKLQGVEPLELPIDFPRPAVQSRKGSVVTFSLGADISEKLQQFSQQQGTTLFMTLLSVFKVLLFRYSGQQDICIGTPIAGRQQQELEELIGFFVNTLALRSDVQGDFSFKELLQQVKKTMLEAYENQDVPFEKVVDAVVQQRDMSRNPLFQVMFILQNTPEVPEFRLGEVELLREASYKHTTALFDINFTVVDTPSGLQGGVEYCTELYREDTIQRMVGHFKQLLSSVLQDPGQRISRLPMLLKSEETQLLKEFNNTARNYSLHKSVVGLFEEQVNNTPNNTALVFENTTLTFQQLNHAVNQLAYFLRRKGVKPKTIVPICIDRSQEMVVGLLAILKAGATYVPIDPDYPMERITYMVEDSRAKIVLSNKANKKKLKGMPALTIIDMDEEKDSISRESRANMGIATGPDDLVHIIYTSGSTGKPKGVMVENRGVVNVLMSMRDDINFTASSSFLSVTTYSFDICYLELYLPLITGGKLIVVKREIAIDGFRLLTAIKFYHPTHLQATPATWLLLLDSNWENKEGVIMITGGETVKENLKEELAKRGVIYNGYGPTETTIYSILKKLETGQKVSIGKPVANTAIYILAKDLQLVPIGVTGEICISGSGLTHGYLNRPELTEEKFIPHPFASHEGERLYKTGDVGRWLSDGNIECLGRIDDQVKLRGYRIELGEIETAMLHSNLINQCAALIKENQHDNSRLVTYYVPKHEVLKDRERTLYENQVKGWEEIYETQYSIQDEKVDEEFDINIWKDSFSGNLIDEANMQEWVNDIVAEVLSEKKGIVLEIGSGSGLIFYKLAGKVKKYIGTDFSRSSVEHIKQRIEKGQRDYGETSFKVCAAHEIVLEENEKVDTVLLNSVVQYFPGEDYMTGVIGKALSLLQKNGRVIIGDVRDNRSLSFFKGRIQLQKLQHSVSLQEFDWVVNQEVIKEEELCFSPQYFHALKAIYPQITNVEIKWKQASYINELSAYRYTVILHTDLEKQLLSPEWKTLKDAGGSQSVIAQLDALVPLIALQQVSNPRLGAEKLLNKISSDKTVNTVGELLQIMQAGDVETNEVTALIKAAGERNYHYTLLLDNDPLKVNLLLELNPSKAFIAPPAFEKSAVSKGSFTNIPLFNDISILIQKELRASLLKVLPDYMVPSDFIALYQLPLTNNGKVNRKFLGQRLERGLLNKFNYQAPQTDIQLQLTVIWQELLGVERVGIYDNFFELGGHSLLAIRLVSAIRKKLDIDLSVNDIFIYPTIAVFSERFFNENKETSVNETDIKHLVPIKKGGNKIPIYIVSGGGGTALRFMEFAEMMDADQPVFVLQAPVESKELKDFPDTVEEIAQKFIQEILVKNPNGPYALSGHCTGGIVAFEMAKQLEAMGKKIHLLAMFDSIIRTRKKAPPATFNNFYRIPFRIRKLIAKIILKIDFETFLLRKHTRQAIKYKINSFRKLINNRRKKRQKEMDELEYVGLEIFQESMAIYVNACKKYNIKPYDKEIVLFYAKEHYYFLDKDNSIGFKKTSIDEETKNMWKRYSKDISIYEIDGEHSSIFETIHGDYFAKSLQEQLNKSTN